MPCLKLPLPASGALLERKLGQWRTGFFSIQRVRQWAAVAQQEAVDRVLTGDNSFQGQLLWSYDFARRNPWVLTKTAGSSRRNKAQMLLACSGLKPLATRARFGFAETRQVRVDGGGVRRLSLLDQWLQAWRYA